MMKSGHFRVDLKMQEHVLTFETEYDIINAGDSDRIIRVFD